MKGYWETSSSWLEKVYKFFKKSNYSLKKKQNKTYVRAIILLPKLPALRGVPSGQRFTIN